MKKDRTTLLVLCSLAVVIACSGSRNEDLLQASGTDRVVLDVRCSADGDCPSGFECESENEHGTSTSYCKSHRSTGSNGDDAGAGASRCPAGFEQETEHAGTFCKPHGGKDDGEVPAAGAAPSGAACTTDADCAPGLECELELEHGLTTAFCKPHGRRSKGGKN
ncbi:MAG: hypothetical protein J0I07_45345 [Myxococcales bacterium]|nr:hypothetical protein [Myxococcales bacterium]